MKNVILVLGVLAVLAVTVSTAEAGRRRYFRGPVRYGWGYPAVTVHRHYSYVPVYRPRVYVPVPVYRPAYYGPRYYGGGTRVHVQGGSYYSGGGVHVRTPGFGLDIRY